MSGFRESFTPVPLKGTNVFKPLKVGNMTWDHRVVLAPLTRMRNKNGVPTDVMREYYRQRSAKKGSFLITEGTFITDAAGGYEAAPGIWSQEQIDHWKPIFKAIHDNQSYSFVQLWALGRQSIPAVLSKNGHKFVSATDDCYMDEASKEAAIESDTPLKGLTNAEIKQYIKDYAQAAKNAIEAGADGVELHSANGYLLNQFLDPKSNKRTDEYGGSIENRARFTIEVVDALVEAVGAKRVGIRLSPFGVFGSMSGVEEPSIVAQYAYVIGELERRAKNGDRLAYIHLVEARVSDPLVAEGEGIVEASNEFIYTIWKGVVVRAGDYGVHPELAKEHSEMGETAISYGRLFISNPDLPDRLYNGQKLNEYNRGLFYHPGAEGYTDYPTYEQAVSKGFVATTETSGYTYEEAASKGFKENVSTTESLSYTNL